VKAAGTLKEAYGLDAELIDLRTLTPLDYSVILESVRKTGRVLLTSDACQRGSYLNDVAQHIAELAFDDLDAPPVVVGSRNWITPAYELEKFFFPQPEWLLDAIHEKIVPLPGHAVSSNRTTVEHLRIAKQGI
jgi:2-oxoisovalerate dehydrogenase E1 component